MTGKGLSGTKWGVGDTKSHGEREGDSGCEID